MSHDIEKSREIDKIPHRPNRIIFGATALIASVVGIVTMNIALFMLTVVGCAIVLCAGYALIRRRFGWQPLNFDYLSDLLRVMSPP